MSFHHLVNFTLIVPTVGLSGRMFCLVVMRVRDIRYVNTVRNDIKVSLLLGVMSNVNVLNLSRRLKMKLTGENIKSFTDLI